MKVRITSSYFCVYKIFNPFNAMVYITALSYNECWATSNHKCLPDVFTTNGNGNTKVKLIFYFPVVHDDYSLFDLYTVEISQIGWKNKTNDQPSHFLNKKAGDNGTRLTNLVKNVFLSSVCEWDKWRQWYQAYNFSEKYFSFISLSMR